MLDIAFYRTDHGSCRVLESHGYNINLYGKEQVEEELAL